MSANDINNLRPHEKRLTSKYDLVLGKIVIVYELEIKDIDTHKFIVAERAFLPTGKTKEEYITDLETKKDDIIALHQVDIDKINAIE